jgi:radical SAM protein with 4Fe4S-binding SPASM domain
MPRSLLGKRREKFVKMDVPFSCHFDLTYHCNLDCIHCYTVEETRSELNTAEIKDILSQLADLGTLYLQLSGGEILLRDDFFEIAEYARKLHFALILNSNGILINEEIADKISILNPYKVNISIYSTDPQVHESITRLPGSLEKSIEAVKLLKERGLWVNITDVLMKQNINDYRKVYQLSKDLGVDCILDPNVTPKIDGDNSPVKFKIGIKDLYRLNIDPIIKLESEQDASLSTEDMHDLISFADDYPCTAAHSFFHISPYGDVFPCPMLSFSCGNLKVDSFSEIWNKSSKMLEARAIRWNNIKDCAKCDDKKYCNYCPGMAYLKTGNMMSSYPNACLEAGMKRKLDNMTGKS